MAGYSILGLTCIALGCVDAARDYCDLDPPDGNTRGVLYRTSLAVFSFTGVILSIFKLHKLKENKEHYVKAIGLGLIAALRLFNVFMYWFAPDLWNFALNPFVLPPSPLVAALVSRFLLKLRQLKHQRPASASGNMTTPVEGLGSSGLAEEVHRTERTSNELRTNIE
ncbi:hypothetical protein M422DRAFT_47176 [Sphaerobolus stellatus SS14]|uniref:Uncharacterized protein n=1 Tax=Sphaerobolus stellatus (strain SS14) TaxID=990650 RepID=A0A0C9UPF2_SPHS4|nr:hypothetical protein M422DRAFT_47176 [Sphaerobolus stellatus SS14]